MVMLVNVDDGMVTYLLDGEVPIVMQEVGEVFIWFVIILSNYESVHLTTCGSMVFSSFQKHFDSMWFAVEGVTW